MRRNDGTVIFFRACKQYFFYVCVVYMLVVAPYLYSYESLNYPSARWSEYPRMYSQQYPKVHALAPLTSYIVADQGSQYVLASYRPSQVHELASLTKLMTAYVVMQKLARKEISLSDTHTISDDTILKSLGDGVSRMGLARNDTVRIEDLLQGLLIVSGNDAALMLAHILFGSEQDFVQEMNNQARVLGLHATTFVDVTGLSPHNISTAYDVLQLANIVLTFEGFDITEITNQSQFTWKKTKSSTNLLLNYFEEVDGLKTGYIEESGFNFVATAERVVQDKSRRLIVVVLGVVAESMVEGVYARARVAEELLHYGFDNFEVIDIRYASQEVKVWGGDDDTVLLVSSSYHDVIPSSWIPLLYSDLRLQKNIWAPLTNDSVLGTVMVYVQVGEKDIAGPDDNVRQGVTKSYTENDDIFITTLEMTPTQYVDKANIFIRIIDYLWSMLFS